MEWQEKRKLLDELSVSLQTSKTEAGIIQRTEGLLGKKDPRIDGEYDPEYVLNNNPSDEEKEVAKRVMEKYEKLGKNKRNHVYGGK